MHVAIWEDHFKRREQKIVKMRNERWEINWACLKSRREAGVLEVSRQGGRAIEDELGGMRKSQIGKALVGRG